MILAILFSFLAASGASVAVNSTAVSFQETNKESESLNSSIALSTVKTARRADLEDEDDANFIGEGINAHDSGPSKSRFPKIERIKEMNGTAESNLSNAPKTNIISENVQKNISSKKNELSSSHKEMVNESPNETNAQTQQKQSSKLTPKSTPNITSSPIKSSQNETPSMTKQTPNKTPSMTKQTPNKTPSMTKQTPNETPSITKQIPNKTPSMTKQTPNETPSITKQIPNETPSITKQILKPTESPIPISTPATTPSMTKQTPKKSPKRTRSPISTPVKTLSPTKQTKSQTKILLPAPTPSSTPYLSNENKAASEVFDEFFDFNEQDLIPVAAATTQNKKKTNKEKNGFMWRKTIPENKKKSPLLKHGNDPAPKNQDTPLKSRIETEDYVSGNSNVPNNNQNFDDNQKQEKEKANNDFDFDDFPPINRAKNDENTDPNSIFKDKHASKSDISSSGESVQNTIKDKYDNSDRPLTDEEIKDWLIDESDMIPARTKQQPNIKQLPEKITNEQPNLNDDFLDFSNNENDLNQKVEKPKRQIIKETPEKLNEPIKQHNDKINIDDTDTHQIIKDEDSINRAFEEWALQHVKGKKNKKRSKKGKNIDSQPYSTFKGSDDYMDNGSESQSKSSFSGNKIKDDDYLEINENEASKVHSSTKNKNSLINSRSSSDVTIPTITSIAAQAFSFVFQKPANVTFKSSSIPTDAFCKIGDSIVSGRVVGPKMISCGLAFPSFALKNLISISFDGVRWSPPAIVDTMPDDLTISLFTGISIGFIIIIIACCARCKHSSRHPLGSAPESFLPMSVQDLPETPFIVDTLENESDL